MRYKQFSELTYNEKNMLFNIRDDILEEVVYEISENRDVDEIEHGEIKEAFYKKFSEQYVIVDLETFDIYKKIS